MIKRLFNKAIDTVFLSSCAVFLSGCGVLVQPESTLHDNVSDQVIEEQH